MEVGNLGEQVTLRILLDLDYQVLGAQDDYLGMVSEVLDSATTAHPEDFIAVDPEGRLLTINSKASISPRSCRVRSDGTLTRPRLAVGQNTVGYSTERANLVSPLNGEAFSQVVKVDLVNLQAQIFEIADKGRVEPVGMPRDITALVEDVLQTFPGAVPPPSAWQ